MDNKWIKIKKHEKYSYYYAERLGKDSIAFVLVDKSRPGQMGLIREFKPPIDDFLTTAFGGSIDKEKSLRDLVEDEVKEEAGYIGARIIPMGSCFVSTQMNQFCHLFLVDISHATAVEKEPDSYLEHLASVVWERESDVLIGQRWKAIVLLVKKRERFEFYPQGV